MQERPDPDAAEEAMSGLRDDVTPTYGFGTVPLVGLGGSAGSIRALQDFFDEVQPGGGLAYAVVIHLSADHPSTLAELIQRRTQLRVSQVAAAVHVEADHVYVIPPGKLLHANGNRLTVSDLGQKSHNMAVDFFFRTLADSHAAHSAAVVLSGVDGDGAIGVKRVKERGGLTIAQEPQEAQHKGMPHAAIATGMVDFTLPVKEMPARIHSYFRVEQVARLPSEEGPLPGAALPDDEAADEAALRDVLTFVRMRTGRDFTAYKRATILRRIRRRMQVNGVENLPDYLKSLRSRPGEVRALLQDLLITVTNFFRDPECFQALQAVVPSLFEGKGPMDTIRVWVPACATGEEAYSIAMLLSEQAGAMDEPPLLQVFATDLDEDAIAVARAGVYPTAIESDVDAERLKRFFTREPKGYRVRRELRESVLFAVHDALKDSPFSRLDLISCRNMLIYLNRDAQARVIDTFRFALQPGGKLFLGSSESVEDETRFFSVLDKKHRIYVQTDTVRAGGPVPEAAPAVAMETPPLRDVPEMRMRTPEPTFEQRPRIERQPVWGEVHLRLIELLAPPSILVDAEHDILHLSPSAGRFLQYGGGEPSRNLLRVIHEGLRVELRAALYQAGESDNTVEVPPSVIDVAGQPTAVGMRVVRAGEARSQLFLVLLTPGPADTEEGRNLPERLDMDLPARHLEHELERLKLHLRETVEQYEASTEELKAGNEELQAMNEELRSASEELETSREELQSINEELTTVNHELKEMVDELGHANSDMQNLMDATGIATIFLDRDLRITRYTPTAVSLFNLIPTDIGRPLSDLTSHLAYPELAADARKVLQQLVPVEREVGEGATSWFVARLQPYRTLDDRIAGVVLSFLDISARKEAEKMRTWLSSVVKATPDAIVSFSLDGTILSWNEMAERTFGYTAEEAVGQNLSFIAGAQADAAPIVGRVAKGESPPHHMVSRRRKDGREIHVSIAAAPIYDVKGRIVAGAAVVRDITELRAVESELQALGNGRP